MAAQPSAVFLLKSPLQYLNALEALAAFDLSLGETLWVLLPDSKSRQQLEALVAAERQDGFRPVFLSDLPLGLEERSLSSFETPRGNPLFGNPLFSIFKLSRLAGLTRKVPLVFIGDLANPLMRHFANRTDPGRVVHLDDGVATLGYAAARAGAEGRGRKPKWSKRIKLALKRGLLGLRDQPLQTLTFFTFYRQLQAGPNDLVMTHDFPCLRKGLQATPASGPVYFLGGPLVEAEFFCEKDYLELLQGVAAYYAGKEVIYVAHRRENTERLKLISSRTGWQAQLFDYPIEYQLAKIGPRPAQLASFFSSGLESCRQVFGPKLDICSFALPERLLRAMPQGKQQALEAAYARMRQIMPVIELPDR